MRRSGIGWDGMGRDEIDVNQNNESNGCLRENWTMWHAATSEERRDDGP